MASKNGARTPLYLAIDVGTGSARAGLFSGDGHKLSYASHPIEMRNQRENHYEQSSADIWRAVKYCVKEVVGSVSNETREEGYVAALGIDATCSLVACSDDGRYKPISVVSDLDEPVDGDVYDVMLWLDHRSTEEADYINNSSDEDIAQVRSHFGHKMSPENEPPKLLWLSKHRPDVIKKGMFFDLADWIAFKCCGNPDIRSASAAASKWGWGSNTNEEQGTWSKSFWDKLDLPALAEDNFHKIGSKVMKPGQSIGKVSGGAAEELGLTTECIVSSAMVDAHAGAIWSVGVDSSLLSEIAPLKEQRLGVIAGTSTCFMQLSREPVFVEGVWGPYRDAVVPGYYVTAGGQSVTGKLLDETMKTHPAYNAWCERVGESNIYDALADKTENQITRGLPDPAQHVHCLDYHAGNRSPRADPTLRGLMTGLSLASDEFDLAVKFRATLQALCYGAKLVVDESIRAGHDVRVVMACGGLCKSDLFLKELADCLQVPVILSAEEDAVLLGGAIVARAAHIGEEEERDEGGDLLGIASTMCGAGRTILPNMSRKAYHDRKFNVYKELYKDYLKYRRMMDVGQDTESVSS